MVELRPREKPLNGCGGTAKPRRSTTLIKNEKRDGMKVVLEGGGKARCPKMASSLYSRPGCQAICSRPRLEVVSTFPSPGVGITLYLGEI